MSSTGKINWKDSEMDAIQDAENYMRPIFDEILSKYKIQKILDLGCGNGLFTSYFRKADIEIHGVDGSPYGLEQARKRGFQQCFHVENFDTSDLPGKDVYDLVISKDVLEHLLYPLEHLVKAHSKIANGGKLLVLIPNHFTLYHRIKFLFTNNIDTQNYFPESNLWDFPHIRFMKAEDLKKMLDLAGFEFVKNYSSRFMFFFPRGNRILRKIGFFKWLLDRFPNSFCTSYCFLVKKKSRIK